MSIAAEVGKKLTWEDICDLSEQRIELVEGDLYLSPTAGFDHQRIGTRLGVLLFNFVEERELRMLSIRDLHYIFDQHNHFEPDLSFLAKDRLHLAPGAYVDGPPDLAIEILSPSTRKRDTELKFQYYARFGVREYWIVDPEAQTIAVFVERNRRFESLGEFSAGQSLQTSVLAGLKLDPAQVF
jgi:Uma2 family endonuclease